ncbi:701_t:CDS:2 [Entrophospora sp. SA101]|nr:701_t:CDS:2 [Entrophospora sp. SA101]
MNEILVKRGEIWLVRFKKKKSLGTEIWKDRPALIISADWQNAKNGKIMTDQVHSFDKKKRLVRKLGILPEETLKKVEETLQELLDQGTLEIAKNADLVIQPVGASNDDLMPAVKEFNALKKAGINKNKLLFVLTRLSTPKEAEAIKEYLKDTAYSFTNNYLSEKTSYKQTQNEGRSITEVSYKNKIKRKGLGIAPQEASENIQASELAPRDKRFTGRTKQLGLSVKPEFSKRLKMIAAEEDCFVIEVLEKALEFYQEAKKVVPKGEISPFINNFLKEYVKKKKLQELKEAYQRTARSKERELEITSYLKKIRPSLVVSNNSQNEFDEEIIVVPLSSKELNNIEPYQFFIKRNKKNGLDEDSKLLFNRLRNIEKATRLGDYIGIADQETMKEVKERLKLVLDLED